MKLLNLLRERYSVSASLLEEPGPTVSELQDILSCGMSVPDHAALKPFRFKVISGEHRKALGNVFKEARLKRDPMVTQADLEAIAAKPLRAPTIVVAYASIQENHPKVPRVEQICTTAMAVQNCLTAAWVKGFGAVLVTGWMAKDPNVKAALGVQEKDEIVGFMYLGSYEKGKVPLKKRPRVEDYIDHGL